MYAMSGTKLRATRPLAAAACLFSFLASQLAFGAEPAEESLLARYRASRNQVLAERATIPASHDVETASESEANRPAPVPIINSYVETSSEPPKPIEFEREPTRSAAGALAHEGTVDVPFVEARPIPLKANAGLRVSPEATTTSEPALAPVVSARVIRESRFGKTGEKPLRPAPVTGLGRPMR